MGISEAFMKLLPENRFIGTEFVPHGKREDMSRFVVRADKFNKKEETTAFQQKLFKIPGREGLYYEKPNLLEKYFRRGKLLDSVCPIQYVKMFDPATMGKQTSDNNNEDDNSNEEEYTFSETEKRFGKEAKFHHVVQTNGKPGKKLPEFVELENPYPGEPKFMRRRKHPKAVRFFKVRQENSPARFFLQELMFYTSFGEQDYNEWQDDDKCTEAYVKKRKEIEEVKKVLMEWLDPVEEARYYIEEVMKNDVNIEEVANVLDASSIHSIHSIQVVGSKMNRREHSEEDEIQTLGKYSRNQADTLFGCNDDRVIGFT